MASLDLLHRSRFQGLFMGTPAMKPREAKLGCSPLPSSAMPSFAMFGQFRRVLRIAQSLDGRRHGRHTTWMYSRNLIHDPKAHVEIRRWEGISVTRFLIVEPRLRESFSMRS